jgi:hypothetical protein
MCPLCPWTHFAGQSATALRGNLKIRAGQIERIDKKDGAKTVTEQKLKSFTIFQQINIEICNRFIFFLFCCLENQIIGKLV